MTHHVIAGPLIGQVIVAGFAVGWMAAGTRGLGGTWSTWLTLVAAAISTALVWHGYLAQQRDAGHVRYFDGLAYGLAVGFESVAIPLAAVALKRMGKSADLLPVIALIVGIHFFGLVWAFRSNACWWLGGVMCALACVALCLPVRLRDVVTGPGCAVILWWALLTAF